MLPQLQPAELFDLGSAFLSPGTSGYLSPGWDNDAYQPCCTGLLGSSERVTDMDEPCTWTFIGQHTQKNTSRHYENTNSKCLRL